MDTVITDHEITALANTLLVRITSGGSYKLPDQHKNKRGAAFFQTVGQLIAKGRQMTVGGYVLDYDYHYKNYHSETVPSDMSYGHGLLFDKGLYMIFTDNKETYAMAHDIQRDIYYLYKVTAGTVQSMPLFELKVNKGMTVDMISFMLSKILFVY